MTASQERGQEKGDVRILALFRSNRPTLVVGPDGRFSHAQGLRAQPSAVRIDSPNHQTVPR